MIDRRASLKMMAAAALMPSAAIAGVPAAPPLLPPLEPLTPEAVASLQRGIWRYLAFAEDTRLPVHDRRTYQHLVGQRACALAYPHADAVARLQRVAEAYPLIKPCVDSVITARIEGKAGLMIGEAYCRPLFSPQGAAMTKADYFANLCVKIGLKLPFSA